FVHTRPVADRSGIPPSTGLAGLAILTTRNLPTKQVSYKTDDSGYCESREAADDVLYNRPGSPILPPAHQYSNRGLADCAFCRRRDLNRRGMPRLLIVNGEKPINHFCFRRREARIRDMARRSSRN